MKVIAIFLIVLIFLFVLVTSLRADATSESGGTGMDWLVFVFALECGLLPSYGFAMYEPDTVYVIADHSLYTDFEASVEAYGFYLGGGMRCFFWKCNGGYDFSPFQMTYRFDAGWRNDHLNIGFRHYCMHPAMPWMPIKGEPQQRWEGAYDELFIRFDGRLPLIKGKEDREVEDRR